MIILFLICSYGGYYYRFMDKEIEVEEMFNLVVKCCVGIFYSLCLNINFI